MSKKIVLTEAPVKRVLPTKVVINKMLEVEAFIAKLPNAKFGDDTCPLKHSFGDDIYIREIFMPKGMLITSKLHKTDHPFFVLRGELSVLTGAGLFKVKAPFFGMTKAGTKRILYIHEDTHWITVHATKETDLKKIESQLIAESYSDLPENVKNVLEAKDAERESICHSQQLERS